MYPLAESTVVPAMLLLSAVARTTSTSAVVAESQRYERATIPNRTTKAIPARMKRRDHAGGSPPPSRKERSMRRLRRSSCFVSVSFVSVGPISAFIFLYQVFVPRFFVPSNISDSRNVALLLLHEFMDQGVCGSRSLWIKILDSFCNGRMLRLANPGVTRLDDGIDKITTPVVGQERAFHCIDRDFFEIIER